MADEIQVAFGKPHEEAIAFIRGKPPVARHVFDGLLPELRARAFTVTGIDEFDRLQRIRDSIASLPAGATWDEAKAEVVDQLDALGDGADRRAELLLRTHGFQAFQAANWNVAQADSDTTHLQYLATEDDRVRDTHLALNGVILPKDDPFWQRHYPPWEWGCRCRVRPINPDLLEEARQQDATQPPEKHLVIEGPALQRLRDGQIIRDNRTFDVTSPADRPGGESAFQWHPGDLHLNATRLAERYDPVVWEQWKQWSQTTEIRPGTTVWDWLGAGKGAPPSVPPVPSAPPAPSTPGPANKPVSVALDLTALKKRLGGVAKRTLEIIDKAHDDGVLPKIPITQDNSTSHHAAFSRPNMKAAKIIISTKSKRPHLALTHEIGHFLDLEAIGGPGAFESEKGAAGLFARFLTEVRNSKAYQLLEQKPPSGFREYLLRKRELWARAYAQWIARRSADRHLLDELAATILDAPGTQWEEADFEPIAKAIDQLFRDLGWIT